MIKYCYKCKKKKGRKDRATYCTECQKKYLQQWHNKNKADRLARMARRKHNMYAWLAKYHEIHPCIDCGETDPIVLEFHHREGVDKKNDVSRLIVQRQFEKAKLEIEKCDVLCSSCHRRRTAVEQNWYWLKILKGRKP